VAELRYRAYISYSHKDETWATWLHRALESYRVPGKLVGVKSTGGVVPARIRPVFRDRDDLSSATDLSSTVKQALHDSENLIVMCSPVAAASRWVNEEIRQFARLGRSDRIFCIIVDGEPANDGSVAHCFPPALAEIGLQEPLAADVRKWADGKQVAKVKLIAGLLGLRLDELRQRDLQRRHRRYVLIGLGIVAALALAAMTVLSQIAERNEREKAEQLATFIVDLGERLQSDTDLETLALISSESFKHLKGIDPNKLSPGTGTKVGLVLRQMGRVSQFQGRPKEALAAFKQSRDLFLSLSSKYPDESGLLFELGNAEYFIGNLDFHRGHFDSALEPMQQYHFLTRKLLETDPDNPDWIMEVSFSHNNLAALQIASGKSLNEETLFHIAEAIRLMESVVALRPDSLAVADTYATTLAWAADAQLGECNLDEAETLRLRSRRQAEYATQANAGNNDLKKLYAFSISGVASIQILTGNLELAETNLRHVISIVQQLSAADPSNVELRQVLGYRRSLLASLLAETGQLDEAVSIMSDIDLHGTYWADLESLGASGQKDQIKFLLVYADIEARQGKLESAKDKLKKAAQMLSSDTEVLVGDIDEVHRIVMARYQWWELEPAESLEMFPRLPDIRQSASDEFRSCTEADSAARIYIMANDKKRAALEVEYLQSRGYAEPEFIRFCQNHDLCDG